MAAWFPEDLPFAAMLQSMRLCKSFHDPALFLQAAFPMEIQIALQFRASTDILEESYLRYQAAHDNDTGSGIPPAVNAVTMPPKDLPYQKSVHN